MSEKNQTEFLYLEKDDYDKEHKINGEKIKVYSPKQMDDLYPDGDYELVGETWERKKRDKDKDIGRIELADKILYVSPPGQHKKIFRRKASYMAVEGGGYLTLLKLRLLPFLLLFLIAALIAGFCVFYESTPHVDTGSIDNNVTVMNAEGLKIYGNVYKENDPYEGAELSAQQSGQQLYTGTSDADGYYEITPVASGHYSVVATCGESVLTKPAEVIGADANVDFYFPRNILKVFLVLKAEDSDTPPNITVAGLAEEGLDRSEEIQAQELDLTMTATRKLEDNLDKTDKSAVEAISGDLDLTWFDFTLCQETLEDGQQLTEEYLQKSNQIFEIAIPYDSSSTVGTYVFRCLNHQAERLTALSDRPTEDFTDGTYFVDADTVYVYMNQMGLYIIGSADAGGQTMGTDMIIYSDGATVNLASKTVTMYYCHDETSTNSARVELYLKGREENVLIAESGIIPPGNEISTMTLTAKTSILPTSDSYEGIMRIVYLGSDGVVATNVEIPVTITFE